MAFRPHTNDKLLRMLLVSFGLIYVWFGMLKFFPGVSPAEALSGSTINLLSFGLLEEMLAVRILAVLEVGIGLLCLLGVKPDKVILLILGHMVCTFSPLILLPELVYGKEPFSLTLVGQYILKNLVFVSALLIAYKMARKPEEQLSQTEEAVLEELVKRPGPIVSNMQDERNVVVLKTSLD